MVPVSPSFRRSTRFWCGVALALALTLLASVADARVEKVERKIKVGSLDLTYTAYVPDGARSAGEVSVLFAFHAGFGTSSSFAEKARIHLAPGAQDFIVVYPEGFRRTWNSGDCCGPAQRRNIDDIAFVKAMFEDLKQFGNISQTRNFATGFSNGFAFSQQLACSLPDRFTAIAGGGGVKDTARGCSGPKPISVMIMHGTVDEYSPFSGGESVVDSAGYRVSAPSVAEFWKSVGRCSSTRTVTMLDKISCTSHTGCSGGAEVVLCPIPEMGHWWPGDAPRLAVGERKFGPARGDLDGAAAVVRFFRSKL
jgi:polyhydroxybutyrate depolymerase